MVSEIKLERSHNSPLGDRGKRIHPHKFTLWVAIGSIIMMFAGLTSAYIVKSGQAGWLEIKWPTAFWYSSAAIVLSSITVQVALRSFKQRDMQQYRRMIAATTLLGTAFVVLQWVGFRQLWESGITFKGVAGPNQFLYVIAGLHALHVTGGVIALIVMFFKAFFGRTKNYSSVPVEIMSTYWHFVDILWIYLLVFFTLIG